MRGIQIFRNTLIAGLLLHAGYHAALSQPKVSVENTLGYLNTLLSGSEELSVKGKFLIIKGFKEGIQVKEDKVNKYDLNPDQVSLSETENLVSIKCYSELDGCVERKSLVVNKKAFRKRVVFEVKSADHGAKVVRALTHLINCFADKKYVGPSSLE